MTSARRRLESVLRDSVWRVVFKLD